MNTEAISSKLLPQSVRPVEKTDQLPAKPKQNEAVAKAAERREQEAVEEPVVDKQAAAETIAAAMFNDFPSNASLEIDVNDHEDGFVYKAVDRDTGEVLKQFPAAVVLERLERMSKVQGLAVDGKV